jgi:hypothetical protein
MTVKNMVDLVKNADLAMYASKECGGNIFKFYSDINKFKHTEQNEARARNA